MDAMIETKGLRKEFGDLVAVNDVSITVKKGEVFGFLGPNGAGKSTTINMLITMLPITAGSGSVAGWDVAKDPDRIRASIGVIMQTNSLEPELTTRENLEYYGRLNHMGPADIPDAVCEVLNVVGLTNKADELVKNLSGGMKRRLEIARSFLHRPGLIFMDEPTTGLDPQTKQAIWRYIRHLNKDQGLTIFLTTHYMEEADALCDRLAIIDHGRIIAEGTPAELKDMIGEGDIIDISLDNEEDDRFAAIAKELGMTARSHEGRLRLHTDRGEERIPDLMAACAGKVHIRSIALHEPTLEDVFIHFTGRSMRE
ncbi:MAG: ATP-binding cassette domain-containing protein [Candidatus Undinarchaeales archaeon]|jgi:ABC-2 type transport system ATP-binding protein|nr:ATP-binding cassette domain-containing protein [Candidatus Undinarchaeales archaeon]MDP7492225.1 ATP-binding cassette domain-containing protein [Candidatus Undinarchaeales archaeon]